jgi:glycogen debranching enzyme
LACVLLLWLGAVGWPHVAHHHSSSSSSSSSSSPGTYLMGVPLWGGVAPAAHAARLLVNMQAADMRSRWGLRSTSSNDTRYSNANIIKPCA